VFIDRLVSSAFSGQILSVWVRLVLTAKEATTLRGSQYHLRSGLLEFGSKFVNLLSGFRRELHTGRRPDRHNCAIG